MMRSAAQMQDVVASLRRVARQLRWHLLVAGLARCAAIVVILATVQLLLDLVLVLGFGPRAALLLIVLAIVIHQMLRQIFPSMTLRISAEDIAAILERARPELRDELVSSVAFASAPARPDRNSPAMVEAVSRIARERFEAVRAVQILNRSRHRRFIGLVAGVLLIAAGGFLWAPDLVATYIARDLLLQDAAWPSRTHIVLEGLVRNRITWPLGDEFTLAATAEGEVPRLLRAEIKLPNGAGAVRDMSRRGENQFLLEYGPLTSSMKLRFLIAKFGADEPTPWYDVEAVERPTVRALTISVAPPAYTELPPATLPIGQPTAEVLRGSRVSIAATVNKKVNTAILRRAGQTITDAVFEPEHRVRADFLPSIGGAYYFDLSDMSGLTDLHPLTAVIRLNNDPPPKVRLNLPGAGEMVVPAAILELDVECEDNLALKSIELEYRVAHEGPAPTTQPDWILEKLPGFEPKLPRYAVKHSWPLSSLSLKPGDQLTLAIRARDFQPQVDSKQPAGVTESSVFTLKIVTPEELLAELGRRENEWRREFELIIKTQEQIKKRVLDLHDQARSVGLTNDAAVAYSREETSQRGQVSRLKTVRRQFEQVLAELTLNQLANPTVHRRLEGGVISPLFRLINTDCVALADQMNAVRRELKRETVDKVEQGEMKLVQDMYAILSNMLKWEGYNEAVGLLRDVIRLQTDVNRQTQVRLEQQVEKLFGPGATSQPEE